MIKIFKTLAKAAAGRKELCALLALTLVVCLAVQMRSPSLVQTVSADSALGSSGSARVSEGQTASQVLLNSPAGTLKQDIAGGTSGKILASAAPMTPLPQDFVEAGAFDENAFYVETTTKSENIAYDKQVQYSSILAAGVSKVVQAGKYGKQTQTYASRYIDGKLIDTTMISDKKTADPVTQVTLVGKPGLAASPLDFSGQYPVSGSVPASYEKVFSGSATAYYAKAGATTNSGRVPMIGHVAVNPNLIGYGSLLYITSADGSYVYGYAIAADTGGSLKSGSVLVDLYYNTYTECILFGVRNVNVYVLESHWES